MAFSRHSRESGNPGGPLLQFDLDFRFRGNDDSYSTAFIKGDHERSGGESSSEEPVRRRTRPLRGVASMIPAREALERLREGNRRFASGVRSVAAMATESRRVALAQNQQPFAIILGCSDSRVPAEIIFDQ